MYIEEKIIIIVVLQYLSYNTGKLIYLIVPIILHESYLYTCIYSQVREYVRDVL